MLRRISPSQGHEDRIGANATQGIALLSPDRWLLWLGVLFVLSVYFFPTGMLGKLRGRTQGAK